MATDVQCAIDRIDEDVEISLGFSLSIEAHLNDQEEFVSNDTFDAEFLDISIMLESAAYREAPGASSQAEYLIVH